MYNKIKYKGLIFCLMMAAMLIGLCGCSLKKKTKLPQLIIGNDNYRPYAYSDEDGNPVGLDVELAKEACRRMGYEPVFKRIDWSKRDNYLADGEIDCIWSCYSMDGLEDAYAWVGPYMHSRQLVAVLEDSTINSLSDLEGKKVAVRNAAKAESIFLEPTEEGVPQVENVYSLNYESEIVTALKNRYVDACADYGAALREQLQMDGIAYRFLDEELSYAKLGVAFSKNSDIELRNKLSDALKDMNEDGTTEKILEKYGVDTAKVLWGGQDEE